MTNIAAHCYFANTKDVIKALNYSESPNIVCV